MCLLYRGDDYDMKGLGAGAQVDVVVRWCQMAANTGDSAGITGSEMTRRISDRQIDDREKCCILRH